MKVIITNGVVLARVNFQESARIVTILSSEQGKFRVIAKGVRKERSKLAGGIELFSVSELSFIRGRGEIGTLVSSRLIKHYGNIVNDIERTMYGYDFLKLINKITEDNVGGEYLELVKHVLEALDNRTISLTIVKLWADMRLLAVTGHTPNLTTDSSGAKLQESKKYEFEMSEMGFFERPNGLFESGHIKLLRLVTRTSPNKLVTVDGIVPFIDSCQLLAQTIRKNTLHI